MKWGVLLLYYLVAFFKKYGLQKFPIRLRFC